MKPIKMFGFATLAALMAMAFLGVSSAMAEGSTALCEQDEDPCAEPITHVHETSVGKAVLLSSINVECDVLFLGDALGGGLANPLVIHGNLTYTNCGSCTVSEENGPAEFNVLKLGHETAKVTGELLWKIVCKGFISCAYNGVGLSGTAKGPLLSTQENGEVTIKEQVTNKEAGGFLCPATSKLDITTTPLEPIYIGGEEQILKMVCIYVGPGNGLYLSVNGAGTLCEGTKHNNYAGEYELGWAAAGTGREEMACVWVGANKGYWLGLAWFGTKECSSSDNPNRKGEYELGVTA